MRGFLFNPLFFFVIIVSNVSAQHNRYVVKVFDSVDIQKNIIYAHADQYDWWNVDKPEPLKLQLYQPLKDTLSRRPLVIMFHGGAFLLGNKKSKKDIRHWCDSLSRMGYVCANVDYRLGYNVLSQKSMIRAGYRAIQDVRAAIRYFKEFHEKYRIDTTKIFIGGNSSGSIASIHAVYMSEEERPIETYGVGRGLESRDLKCLDCSGNEYAHSADVAGIISLWGGIYTPEMIETDEAVPMLLVHGTKDKIVPIGEGRPFKLPMFPVIYGSEKIHARMQELSLDSEYYPFKEERHTFYHRRPFLLFPNENWEPVLELGKKFLLDQLGSSSNVALNQDKEITSDSRR